MSAVEVILQLRCENHVLASQNQALVMRLAVSDPFLGGARAMVGHGFVYVPYNVMISRKEKTCNSPNLFRTRNDMP